MSQVHLRLAAAHDADQHPATVQGQQFDVELGVARPHRVENDVERCKVAQPFKTFAAYHTALRTQFDAIGQPFGRADADPHRVTKRLAKLNPG